MDNLQIIAEAEEVNINLPYEQINHENSFLEIPPPTENEFSCHIGVKSNLKKKRPISKIRQNLTMKRLS